ncbi:MAG: cobalamin-dependent protein [Bacillota bacterium]|jgi:methanogenic corrinoid protein MtbC1|nr:cobalamin-dependent protein [Bacillota bacterium]HHU29797.1 cobalamin-binding protein [Bacillota bacterium]
MAYSVLKEKLIAAVTELEEDEVLKLAEKALREGMEPVELLKTINLGMHNVGKLYEEKTYFIADLIMAGIIFKGVLGLKGMQEVFYSKDQKKIGRVVLGTVAGDLHDIGKDIFRGFMEANNFEVIDVGVDVPKDVFVRKVRENKPDILGLSGILTYTVEVMKEVVDALMEAGIRDSVKVIVGGGHLTDATSRYIGADAYANDAFDGVKICLQWMQAAKRGEG